VIEAFLSAWALFRDALLVAVLLGCLLPLCGIVLLLRQQVFLTAAVGQAATLGIALGISLGMPVGAASGSHEETATLLLAVAAGAVTTVVAMRALSRGGPQFEATSAWLFLLGSSLSVLLAARLPHGLEEVRRLTLSSLLGASPEDVVIAAAALAATALGVVLLRARILMWATDPVTAQVHGDSPLAFDLAVGGWIGACIGFAIHATGLLFAFGATVLPVLIARELCSSQRAVWICAPLVGGAGTLVALFVAHQESVDLPPGQTAVALQCALVALARLWRWQATVRGRKPARPLVPPRAHA